MKEECRKKKEKEHFSYVSKEMLKLIISNVYFWTGCVIPMNAHFLKDSESSVFYLILSKIESWIGKNEEDERFPLSLLDVLLIYYWSIKIM